MQVIDDVVQQNTTETWREGLKDIVHDFAAQLTDEKPNKSPWNGTH